MPYRAIDLTPVRTYSLARRASRVRAAALLRPTDPPPHFHHPELTEVADRVAAARRAGAPVIAMFGGHVIKRGLALLLADLLERGAVTHLASNGAAAIHDFEMALQGSTSEDVAASLEDGSFGMAEETGAFMNRAIQAGVEAGMGLGEALGHWIASAPPEAFPFRDSSLLYHAFRLGIPYTVHVAIGTDIIHQHPLADFAATGWASGQDFKIFTRAVSALEGGVFLNFGSAVIGPEVFLKALSIARNLGHPTRVFTTANFDLVPLGDYRAPIGDDQVDYYYRPRKNIVNRPTSLGGRGFHIVGDHKDTLPNLAACVRAGLEGSGLEAVSQRVESGDLTPRPPFPRSKTSVTGRGRLTTCLPSPFPLGKGDKRGLGPPENPSTALSRPRLVAILDALPGLRAGVIGDFTLDAYWYADMTRSRLSRETPLFPRPVVREAYSPGGAANVAWNLAALGVGRTEAFTVLGADWRADLLRGALASAGVSLEHALTLPGRSTPLFGKVILEGEAPAQEDARLDFVNTAPLPVEVEAALMERIRAAAPSLGAVIVADYQESGIFSPRVREALSSMAEAGGPVWVADSREHLGDFHGMVRKPNEVEAARLLFPGRAPAEIREADLRAAGLALHDRAGLPVCITLGERGCLLFAGGQVARLPAVAVPPPVDPVGAGDTFVACLSACLGAGAAPAEAAAVAALAAAVTVRVLRATGTASPQQILDLFDSQEEI